MAATPTQAFRMRPILLSTGHRCREFSGQLGALALPLSAMVGLMQDEVKQRVAARPGFAVHVVLDQQSLGCPVGSYLVADRLSTDAVETGDIGGACRALRILRRRINCQSDFSEHFAKSKRNMPAQKA